VAGQRAISGAPRIRHFRRPLIPRLLRGAVDIFRELDGEAILLGTVGAGQFIGEMGFVENRPRSATARAASEVEVEILTPTEFFDQIASTIVSSTTNDETAEHL
jgi:CRP-like cAMP-binding protein